MTSLFLSALVLSVAVLLIAEARRHELLRWWAKPAASLLVLGLGWISLHHVAQLPRLLAWPTASSHADITRLVVFGALGLALMGDVCLLPRGKTKWFTLGIAAFLGAHIAYVIAFARLGIAWGALAAATVPCALIASVTLRWLLPRAGRMRGPVAVYICVISAMVPLAVSASASTSDPRWVLGAIAFYVSDWFVARERFVARGFYNKVWGLPLYYVAQATFAVSMAAIT